MKELLPVTASRELAWPALLPAPAASMLAIQWQLEECQWWPPHELLRRQFDQLRQLAAHAVRHVPHYRDALRAAGVAHAGELDPATFLRWPVLRKGDIRSNEAALTAAHVPAQHGRRSFTYTTGSTGEPTRVTHTEVTQFFADALAIHDHLLHGRDLEAKYAVLKSSAQRTTQPGWGVINALFPTGPAVANSTSLDIDRQLDWLVEERPAYLQSYCSNLLALLRRSIAVRKIPQGIRQLIGYGEMPPADLAGLAREAWGAEFVATYSCMETGPIASQCPQHDHYLVHAPVVYVEVLRGNGEPCAPGEIGRVVVTALHNYAMPLIRYELGDYAEVGGPCPTGRGLATLSRIVGRYRNMLLDPNGRQSWPSFPGELWFAVAPVQQVRLVQRALDEIEVQYVMVRELTDAEQAAARRALTEKLGYPFRFLFTRHDRLQRAVGGKWEDFVSLLPNR